ncbi:MAG: cbb3-type cytochrome c oxidase subunit 3 [Rhodobacteraceae bacterium]|nr:cbb3-type cytochrome c oxidase subunit 3 [Paracoccaceae bacterium]TVR47932.1 MAG: cbb3-type cytochrome c oxidase subunit 3 [Paracoccaceae bacterium]
METYDTLRYVISIVSLVAMFVLFIGVVLFIFRPGSKKVQDETSNAIFRNDDKPKQTTRDGEPLSGNQEGH